MENKCFAPGAFLPILELKDFFIYSEGGVINGRTAPIINS
jgi:hypothetical protein